MKFQLKHLIIILVLLLIGYFGWRYYNYFFDVSVPCIVLSGIEENKHYRADVPATVSGKHSFCVSTISVSLDGRPLIDKFKINARTFDHQFSIPTKTLPNGQHTLKIEATDGTYAHHGVTNEVCFIVDNAPLQAAVVKASDKVFQGRTLHVQFQANKELKNARAHAISHSYECFPESKKSLVYECFIPITCEEVPNEYVLVLELEDNVGNQLTLEKKFQVVLFPFKKSVLVIDPDKVKQEREIGILEAQLDRDMEALTKKSPKEKLWQGSFFPPIEITRVTTDFGTMRTTQERGRYMHKAVDVIAAPRSVVWATQDGIVVMKERYAHSGNTVVIDHGFGILSLFFHLEDFADIRVGDKIKRGNPVGTLGKTGYASGYHLHWEMRVNDIAIDPLQWIMPNF